MKKGSIAFSLVWLSLGWLVIALVATGVLLVELYRSAIDNALTETLEVYTETLVTRTIDAGDPTNAELVRLGQEPFQRTGSGWYYVIRNEAGTLLNFSPSIVGETLPEITEPFNEENLRTAVVTDPFGTRIKMLEREMTADGLPLRVLVTGSLDEVFRDVDEFRGQIVIVLVAVAIMLAIMTGIAMRLALRPLGKLSLAIERIREGEAETVTGTYPAEIAPLADEVNELLRSNTQIIERAQSAVGNLAHGLKTPIAVLRNEASAAKDNPLAKVVLSELDKMQQLVTTYLDRARIAARTSVVGKKADATLVMLRLTRVLQKLNKHVTIAFKRPDASLPWFRGDEGDLEEMAGNLLDNATKWSKGQIAVSMQAERSKSGTTLLIKVEDDGPGLTDEQMTAVLKRGVKLDEKVQGSGLGLDIVKELVDVYGGSLKLKRSVLGGLLAELRLPGAKLGGLRAPTATPPTSTSTPAAS